MMNKIAWAASHASNQPEPSDPIGLSALLPLFFEKSAATIPMVRDGMNIIRLNKQFDKTIKPRASTYNGR